MTCQKDGMCSKLFSRLYKDFRQKELLPLKILFFVNSSTFFVLYPYLTIHMRELGINVEEAAIMSAVIPIVTIVMPPMAGIIADHIGDYKILLSVFSALGGLSSLLLLLIPVGRLTISYPDRAMFQLNCDSGLSKLHYIDPYPCQGWTNQSDKGFEFPLRMEVCGLACFMDGTQLSSSELDRVVFQAQNFTMEETNKLGTERFTSKLTRYVPDDKSAKDIREIKHSPNPSNFATTIRRLDEGYYFFPTSGLYKFVCDENGCGPVKSREVVEPKSYTVKVEYESHSEPTLLRLASFQIDSHFFGNSSCSFPVSKAKLFVSMATFNSSDEDEVLQTSNCTASCLATIARSAICSNLNEEKEFDINFTFWTYLSVRVLIGVMTATILAMFEGAVIAILREHKGDYGLQRIYATIGGMVSSPLSGWLIDRASQGKSYTDFRPAFYFYAFLKIVSSVLMLAINLEFKAPARNVLSEVISVVKQVQIIALLATCFILGAAWGYIESFLFWFLQDLGGSGSLMGITITVGGIAGIPLLALSGPIIDKLGHANVIFMGFIFYAIRLVGYSMIYNPWMCLIFEAMESVTTSLAITAAVTYAAKFSTNTTDSSVQGLLTAFYVGVGRGSGSLVGGYLMKIVGTRPTYRIFAAVTLVTGIVYYLFNKFYIERTQKVHEGETKPVEKKPPTEIECLKTETGKDYKVNGETKQGIINEGFSSDGGKNDAISIEGSILKERNSGTAERQLENEK